MDVTPSRQGVGARNPAEMAARFLEHNLSGARLSEDLKEIVRHAARSTQIVETADGGVGLTRDGALFATPLDELTMFETARRAAAESTLVIFGLGVGHAARQLRALTNAQLAVFEPDPGIVRSHFESGPSDLRDLPIICSIHELNQLWTGLSNANQSVTLVNTPGYTQLFPEQAKKLSEALAQLVQRNSINDATHRVRARTWIQDLFANLDLLTEHPSFLALSGKYRGVPAFIVGAGPSLGKNGKLLADATQKGIVFAVNSSAPALASYGVEPQVVAYMESIDVSHLLLQVPYLDRVVRAFSLTAHPQSARTGLGPALPVFENISQVNAPLQALLGFPGLSVAGSVTTLAFSLAQRLGCSPIVLVGQDLAYTDGQAYAQGTLYEDSRVRRSADGTHLELEWSETLKKTHNHGAHKMREREQLREVPAWGGTGTAFSTLGFTAVHGWFEFAAVVLASECPEQRLVNATEGGARITGFEEQRLADVLADLPARHITAAELGRRAREAAPPLSPTQIAAWCDQYAGLSRRVRHAARRIRRLTEVALAALKAGNAAQVTRNFSRLELAELELRNAAAPIPFVEAWAHADLEMPDNETPELNADEQQNARRSVEREQRMAQAIERAASDVEAEFERLKATLTARGPADAARAADEVEPATM